jgi:hypothetical protein
MAGAKAVALAMHVDPAVEIEKFVRRKKLTQTSSPAATAAARSTMSSVLRCMPKAG